MSNWKHRFTAAARGLTRALVAGGLGLLAFSAFADDDPPGRVGRLSDMQGQVWLLEAGQGEWQTAERNRPVTTADRIATDNGGRAELQIGSTTVRLGEASDLEVNRLDDDRIELTLHGGAASLRVREPEVAREVQMTTAEGRFQPRGPGLFRIDHSDRGSMAGATQGEMDFESNDSQLTLRPGQRAELWVDASDRRTHYNWTGAPNDEFEQWVRSDDAQDQQRYAVRRPVSPEMTGSEDLERNGAWDNHPEYGAIWYPTTVVAGWAPYRYGHWAWVRPWGWTWVDDASWGFAPFHYGRWVSYRGRWCWAPGTYVRRPVYAPAMVAWVGGPHVSVSVHIGGGQPVGWVPLAPREVYYPAYRVSPVYVRQVNVTHVHVTEKIIVKPTRPIMYANGNVKGGVTMVSSDVLTRRQAIGTAARVNDDVAVREIRNQRGAEQEAPPTPANASFAARAVRQPGRQADVPPPRSAMPANRAAVGNDNDRGARADADRRGAQPGRQGEPVPVRPQAAANPREDARENARDNARESGRDKVREQQDAPRVARPPLNSAPGREVNREAGREPNRDATQGVPQARRETSEAPARVSPPPREQRDRDQRDQRDQREQLQQPREQLQQQRESPRQPVPQQAAPQRQMPQAPAPRVAPREERQAEPQPRQVERQQPERQVERQVQRQPERQIERQPERREQRHEPQREDKRDKRDKRDGPNALN